MSQAVRTPKVPRVRSTDRINLSPYGLAQAIREAETTDEAAKLVQAPRFSLPLWDGVRR